MSIEEPTLLPWTTSSEAAVYDAVPLPPGSRNTIRLLRIFDGSEGDPISCALHVASLDDTYVAVSYMWGEGPPTKTILLNGHSFPVRQNLWDFLHQRRQDQEEEKEREEEKNENEEEEADGDAMYLWIDALCINQKDDSEKSHQVAMMGEIYVCAYWVQIWLGAEKESLSRAMTLLQDIEENIDDDPSPNIPYEELLELCDHPYWSRAWILQECVLAEALQLQCGPKQASIAAIARLYMSRFMNRKLIRAADMELHDCFSDSAAIRVLQARQKYDPSEGSYYHPWIDHGRLVECTHPRDRIYAMISLMDPAEARIVPDYAKSVEEVFVDLVDNHVERGPYRANHVANIATLLDLVPFDKEFEHWPAVVFAKMEEASRTGKGATEPH